MNNIFIKCIEDNFNLDLENFGRNLILIKNKIPVYLSNNFIKYIHGRYVENVEDFEDFIGKNKYIYEFNISIIHEKIEESDGFSIYILSSEKNSNFYRKCNSILKILTSFINENNIGNLNIDVKF
ncbi:MAG: hypothetical protein EOL97_14610 [Spirochaetia bacterium]|nr:hypothetical protein [Spirochaetia bacterium]